MGSVTEDPGQAGVELSAADKQVLRELTERARAGGLKLTDGGSPLNGVASAENDRLRPAQV